MLTPYRQQQKQLRQQQVEEWQAFHFFQENIRQLMTQRHAAEKRTCTSLAQQVHLDRRHQQELAELAQGKALAVGLLQEQHSHQKALLKLEYRSK